MSLDSDYLVDRRRLSRKITFWRIAAFGVAVLAVIGAAVMLFNWIVINFVITGLHSYA